MANEIEPRAPRGRPSQFDQERAARLISAVRGGNYLSTAAQFAGISYSTLRRWILKADDPDAPDEYRVFREEIEKAQADGEVAALAKINKAASEGAWQAAAWYLERSRPESWGRRDTNRIELVGGTDARGETKSVGGIQLDAAGMNALAQRLANRRAEEEADIVDAELVEDDELEQALDVFVDDPVVRDRLDGLDS